MESLALLCERLYNSQDSAERTHAENTLKCFSTNIDYISQCQYILDNALTPYALMLASSSLLKQVTEHSLSLQLRLDIRNYLINYLANRGPELQPFVIGSLVQLLSKSRIAFITSSEVACSFRDQCLFQIFQISLTSLHQLKNDAISRLQELALSLSLKCLSFDFVGTSIDESSEEFGTVQSLECLVRLASVRRSLFTNDVTRSKFLDHLMSGTKEILRTGQGLADHDNYHEFCRLLGRFRVNYQLNLSSTSFPVRQHKVLVLWSILVVVRAKADAGLTSGRPQAPSVVKMVVG
ncbi:Exportin-7 [Sesamum angolense]|uniref:Exportin-7 n=1 Tax=Sesamum angolense TaxID=2727404 RepID=A0AAE2C6V8_9LAMI|nr:Exportin-7 [Sesamum angolense]